MTPLTGRPIIVPMLEDETAAETVTMAPQPLAHEMLDDARTMTPT